MGINNEGIIDRRRLLVKSGSLMKLSWRQSRKKLLIDEDDDNDNSILKQSGRGKKRNLSVRFGEHLNVVHSNCDEFLTDEEIEERWYQTGDYNRFKKDTILNSLNYINAKRASKPFDATTNCIRGIENMCILNPAIQKRNEAEKKYLYRAVREEQARQKKEWQQKQLQTETNGKTTSSTPYPDLEKFRSASVSHTKGERERALARASEWARAELRNQGLGRTRMLSSSKKNLFGSFRGLNTATATPS